ncbi:MAG TPA: hypothetical protein PKC03_15260 [Dokdonella sp.]|jgi:hypothetical protein|nr:hypothetical protein [Dokdonella sp.]
MPADFTKPVANNDRADNLVATKDTLVALAQLLEDLSPTGLASGFKRWSATNKRFERYNGTSWVAITDEMAQLVKEPVATVASGATVDLGAQSGRIVAITGTTTITSFGTADDGVLRYVRFSGALTLTHNATSLALPGAANITTASGDWLIAESLGAGNWRVRLYRTAGGMFIVSTPTSDLHAATKKYVDDLNATSGTWTPSVSAVTNVASSTAYLCRYSRVGNTVTVSGVVDIDPTAADTGTIFDLTLPIASAFAAITNANGTFNTASASRGGVIYANATDARLRCSFTPQTASALQLYFVAQYVVI